MNSKRSSIGLSTVLVFVLLSCGDCEPPPFRIVKRPGKNPLKCFKKGETSKCIEVTSEEAGKGNGRIEDPHDVQKGPLGGKIYNLGGSVMECFPNGNCFPVNEKDMKAIPTPTTLLPTTLLPTTLAPTTLVPTTLAPTTFVPTTLAPTTFVPTTLAPTTAVTKKPAGRFFRRGKEIVECFPTGKCNVVVVGNPDPGALAPSR